MLSDVSKKTRIVTTLIALGLGISAFAVAPAIALAQETPSAPISLHWCAFWDDHGTKSNYHCYYDETKKQCVYWLPGEAKHDTTTAKYFGCQVDTFTPPY
jgi:hypothetical protein